jgi:hypothetical protein
MARNMKASWQIILKRSKKEKRYAEENTARPRLIKITLTHTHANSVKNAKT